MSKIKNGLRPTAAEILLAMLESGEELPKEWVANKEYLPIRLGRPFVRTCLPEATWRLLKEEE